MFFSFNVVKIIRFVWVFFRNNQQLFKRKAKKKDEFRFTFYSMYVFDRRHENAQASQ